jgi:hypothetical protein
MRGWGFALAAVLLAAAMMVPTVATAAPAPSSVAWSPSGGFSYGTLDAALGQTSSHTFTLSGKSAGVIAVTVSGSSAFSKTADACTGTRLAPKKTCTVTVKYAPTRNGTDVGTLAAASPNAPTANVNLSGTSAWSNGDLTTFDQLTWGAPVVPGEVGAPEILHDNYSFVYAPTFGLFQIGLASGGFSILFTDSMYMTDYLPAVGELGPLDANLLNPLSSSSGSFGGEIATLKLNIDFADAGLLPGNSGLKLGDLTVCGLTTATDLNGQSVRAVLGVDNIALGGGATADSILDLYQTTAQLNTVFSFGGTPTTWAQDHLVNGTCP